MKTIVKGAIAAALLAVAPLTANALTWYLHDVAFEDGATASGSFDFDGSSYSNVGITTSGGSTFGPLSFSLESTRSNDKFLYGLQDDTPVGDTILYLVFNETLNSGSDSITLRTDPRFDGLITCVGGGTRTCLNVSDPKTALIGGYISTELPAAIPLPAAGWLLGCAFGALALRRRRSDRA